MTLSVKHTPQRETVYDEQEEQESSVEEFVLIELFRKTLYGGLKLPLEERPQVLARAFARLLEVLIKKGLINKDDLFDVMQTYNDFEVVNDE